jgi:hypothetical protein
LSVSLLKLLIQQTPQHEQKLKNFFEILKNKKNPNLNDFLPNNFSENLKLVLSKMLSMNPQMRPSSSLLYHLVSTENFLSMKLINSSFDHQESFSVGHLTEKNENSNIDKESQITCDLKANTNPIQHNKKIVFDFEFLSKKTKKGSLSIESKNSILNSILDFPLGFASPKIDPYKKKSQSHDVSPDKNFKFPSFINSYPELKGEILISSGKGCKEEQTFEFFKEFELKDPSKKTNFGYSCPENNFSKIPLIES